MVVDYDTWTWERWRELCDRPSASAPTPRREFMVLTCAFPSCGFVIDVEFDAAFTHDQCRMLRGRYRDQMKTHLFQRHKVFGSRRGDFLETYRYED